MFFFCHVLTHLRKVADNIVATVKALKSQEWEISQADDDEEADDTAHCFFSAEAFPNCRSIFRIFHRLMAGMHIVSGWW